MDLETLARTIQTILAPVVMVTACAIVLGGLWGHSASINDRLRNMTRERLDLWRTATDDRYANERTQEIDAQAPLLLRRHQRIHDALATIYCAILLYISCMLAIAAAATLKVSWMATLALLLFLAGTLLLLAGIVLAILEIRVSQAAIDYEVRRVLSLHR